MKMLDRNESLRKALGMLMPKEPLVEANAVPSYDATNKCGAPAYSLSDELQLVTMLNVLTLSPQYYRTEGETIKELSDLIKRIAEKDAYFVAQAICWSRNQGEGMRSINHLAAALLAPYLVGKDWAKRFYGPYDRKTKSGGCIFRPDDMVEIKDAFVAIANHPLTNPMRKGFASVIESLGNYQLTKYRQSIIDISNLVHPKSVNSKAEIDIEPEVAEKNKFSTTHVKTIDAIMRGIVVSADTWEVAQSDAGQEVAKAVREGKLTEEMAAKVLADAKNFNWESLLRDDKLGILAAIRNARNILKVATTPVLKQLCALISNGMRIRDGRVMPYQIDYAYEVVKMEFGDTANGRTVMDALTKGYELSVPNLKEALPGKTCVMVDCSGSMSDLCHNGNTKNVIRATAAEKAGLIAATIAKATNADIIRFGSNASFFSYNTNTPVFDLGREIGRANLGGTSISSAFDLILRNKRTYDRIILLSDNEANMKSPCSDKWVDETYKDYIRKVCNPYVYAVDLAAYGTTAISGNKVNYYFGYGPTMFEDISSKEFNAEKVIDRVRNYKI